MRRLILIVPWLLLAMTLTAPSGRAQTSKPAAHPRGAESKPADDTPRLVLERINVFRKAAGLSPVTMDAALSKGCRAHAEYLLRNQNHPSVAGLGAHEENPSLPGYSKEGEKAGHAADIHFIEPVASVDGWMASLFHRVPLLDPTLGKVGFGAVRNGADGWFVICDVSSGVGGGKRAAGLAMPAVIYPADKQKDVPCQFGGEMPDPLPESADHRVGYPITAQFPEGLPVKDITVLVKDAQGKPVECWVSTPEKPSNARYQANAVCAMAKTPLASGATYTVQMAGKVSGRAWHVDWKFTTEGTPEPPPPPK